MTPPGAGVISGRNRSAPGGTPKRPTSIFKKGRKYIFMVISPAEVYLAGLVDAGGKRGLMAMVNEDTLFSKAAAAGAVEAGKKKGLQVVFREAYPKGNTDFSALLTKRFRGRELLVDPEVSRPYLDG